MDETDTKATANDNQNNCPACGASFVSVVPEEGCAVCTIVRRSSSGVIQSVLELAVADASEIMLQRGPISSTISDWNQRDEKTSNIIEESATGSALSANSTVSAGVAIRVEDSSEIVTMMNSAMVTPQRLSAEINSSFPSPELPSPGSSVEGIQQLARRMESYYAHAKNGITSGPAVERDDVAGKAAVAATISDALVETMRRAASAVADVSLAGAGKPLDAAHVHAILTQHLMPVTPGSTSRNDDDTGGPAVSTSSEESGGEESGGDRREVDTFAVPSPLLWTLERSMLLQRVVQLENESQIIARRILDQQALSAREMASLEIENESLRSYVDRLMSQLLQARMDQPMNDAKLTPTTKRGLSPKSRIFSSDK